MSASGQFWAEITPERKAEIFEKSRLTRLRNKVERLQQRQEAEKEKLIPEKLRKEIKQLESDLAFLKQEKVMAEAMPELASKSLLRESEIVAISKNWAKTCGVYFLIKNDRIVYVGQSVHVFSRITGHADKEFDRFAYIPCDKNSLSALESIYIHMLQPPLNGIDRAGKKFAPVPFLKLIGEIK